MSKKWCSIVADSSRKSRKNVTLRDVAADAGISRSTASLVLRNSPLVAEETRQRVLESVRRLGYVYNRGAASLRSHLSYTIGLVIVDVTNPFFAELTVGVEKQLEEAGYIALLGSTSDTVRRQEHLLTKIQEHRPDGILLCPARGTSRTAIEKLKRQIPVVLFVRYLPDLQVDYVGVDNITGADMAVEHLVTHGHRQIAFIGGPENSSARRERLQGYRNAYNRHGLRVNEELFVTSPVTRTGGYQAIVELMTQHKQITACLCYNDVVAFGVHLGLEALGLTVGEEFAIIGFDDVAEAAVRHPALTTVALNPRQVGEAAAQLLLDRIAYPDAPPRRVIFSTQLIIRESCGTAKKPSDLLP